MSAADYIGDHRNIGTNDVDYPDFDAYLDDRLEVFFDYDHLSEASHDWDFVLDVRKLYEEGLFGKLLAKVDNQPTRERWWELRDADCVRCGKANVGLIGVHDAVECPDGEIRAIHQHAKLCPQCHDQAMKDLEEYGKIQPSLFQTMGGSND